MNKTEYLEALNRASGENLSSLKGDCQAPYKVISDKGNLFA